MTVLGFHFAQLQIPRKPTKMIHLISQAGGSYGVPDLYDLRPVADTADDSQRAVMLDRPATQPVELWRGPAPLARDLISNINAAVERATSGEEIDVATLAQSLETP